MRKAEIDHLLENAVARALGVKLPHARKQPRPLRQKAHPHRPIRRAA